MTPEQIAALQAAGYGKLAEDYEAGRLDCSPDFLVQALANELIASNERGALLADVLRASQDAYNELANKFKESIAEARTFIAASDSAVNAGIRAAEIAAKFSDSMYYGVLLIAAEMPDLGIELLQVLRDHPQAGLFRAALSIAMNTDGDTAEEWNEELDSLMELGKFPAADLELLRRTVDHG